MRLYTEFIESENRVVAEGVPDRNLRGPSVSFEPPKGDHPFTGGKIVGIEIGGRGWWVTWMVPDDWKEKS